MTDVTTPDQVVPDEVVEEDHDLATEARRADSSAKSAREYRAEAFAELNRFRWEMTVCEYGPRFSDPVYAKAVGQSPNTINKGAAAWQATLDASESSSDRMNRSDCAYGGEPHHVAEVEVPAAKKTKVSKAQTETHDEARRKVDAGEIKAAAIELLAAHFGLSPTTVEVNYRERVNEAIARLHSGHDVDAMTQGDIRQALNNIAMAMRQEDKLRARREDEVRRWMATNRGIPATEVKVADVRSKMDRIDQVAARKEIAWGEAAAEVRESDEKHNAAAKLRNELARKARLAVLDLREAAADLKTAAIRFTKAVQKIDSEGIELSADELELSLDDIADAEAAIGLARAALTGDSGTDWDAKLASLQGERREE